MQVHEAEQNVQGYLSSLVCSIARKAHVRMKLVVAEESSFASLLKQGKVDAVLSDAPVDSLLPYEFSDPLLKVGTIVVVPRASVHVDSRHLKNVELAYVNGDEIPFELGSYTSWRFRPYDTAVQAVSGVINGEVDGALLPFLEANRLCKGLCRNLLRPLPPPVTEQQLRLAVLRGNTKLLELFNNGLRACTQTGERDQFLEYWNLDLAMGA